MKQEEFDRALMDEMSQLPPEAGALEEFTPWQSCVYKILWGMGLTTFRLEFFYLHYLLPLLGSVLLYLGYRSLRRENRWFRLCWGLSGFLLAWHMAVDILSATPIMGAIAAMPSVNWSLSGLMAAIHVVLLFSLRQGLRSAFSTNGRRPRDWMGLGLAAYLLSLAVALWSDLVPLTETGLFGLSISQEWGWLYYARGIAFTALQIFLLVCIARQGEALAGLGYDIVPAPVKVPGRTLLLAVFLTVLAALPSALWLGGRIPMGEAQAVTAPLAGEQAAVRDRLVALGLPEDVADAMDEEELALCAGAVAVETVVWSDLDLTDDDEPLVEGDSLLVRPGDGRAELSVWLVFLPRGQLRYYCWFQYRELPSLRLQEQFSIDPSPNYPGRDYTGGLLWERDGLTYTVQPKVELAGGETAQELEGFALEWNRHELERLGHLHYSPWFSFSIPRGAQGLQGYLAYTLDISGAQEWEGDFYDYVHVFLRHQTDWLHYPFVSIGDLGGRRYAGQYGPIATGYGSPYYNTPLPD